MAQEKKTLAPGVLAQPRITVTDVAMLLLALGSVTLVLADVFFRRYLYEFGIFRQVVYVDLAITAVFLIEFAIKTGLTRNVIKLLRENWFDLLGMIPLIAFVVLEAKFRGVPFMDAINGNVMLLGSSATAGGLLRLFRFIRIVRIVQAFSRFSRATNMTFGEQMTRRIFDKYRRIIVAELTTPIMVAGITMTQEVIVRMKFLDSAGKAIDSKRDEIHAAVIEALQRNKIPDSVITQPLVERIVAQVEETVVNTVVDTLTGPELNKLTQEMIVEVLQQFKTQLTSEEGKKMLREMGKPPA